jgi:hypothetical protein
MRPHVQIKLYIEKQRMMTRCGSRIGLRMRTKSEGDELPQIVIQIDECNIASIGCKS